MISYDSAGYLTKLSSRPERSVVEGPAVSSLRPIRKLLIKVTALPLVIPTGAQRSGGICCFTFGLSQSACLADLRAVLGFTNT
jgi:hypothetical protein